jgi:predicted anti-sigma-YlaC factor YlaD
MSCRRMQEHISLYLDNSLDSKQAKLLEAHLVYCPKCGEKLNLMKQIPLALQADHMLAPHADFTVTVMHRLVAHEQVAKQATTGLEERPKVVSLEAARNNHASRSVFQYSLRLASMAAVFVVFFVGVAAMGGGSVNGVQANISAGINTFALTVVESLQNPVVLVVGVAVTVLLIAFFWWYLVKKPSHKPRQ